jgi:hypothetical protein
MDNFDTYTSDLMQISLMKYQYLRPDKKYDGQTRNANYVLETEWHNYFCVDFYKNYFIEDELEFLKALRQDLQSELDSLNKTIEDNEKSLKKRK